MKKTDLKKYDLDISNRIARLSDDKRALLEARLQEIGSKRDIRIQKRHGDQETAPLSFAQERLWFLSQLEPESAFYNEAGAIELIGKLNNYALAQSLREIVRRHEILRTTFVAYEGHPRQRIAPESEIEIRYEDFQHLPAHQQAHAIKQYMSEEVKRPFNLNIGPLIRFALIRLTGEQHILLVGLHHIIADEWSIRILLNELGAAYGAFCIGQPSPLPELPIQYADYAYWQREWLKGPIFNRQIAYWTEQLKHSPALLELPTDFPRSSVSRHVGTRYYFEISQETTICLHQLAKNHSATLFMVLAASFAILLNRYTHQQDICIGYPIANRARIGLQALIGFFANTLVLRTNLSGNPTFSEILRRVRKTCLDAQAHQDLPFEKLVEELAPVRDMAFNPLFQVMLVFQSSVEERLELPDIKLNEIDVETQSAKFDLTLGIREENGTLKGWFEYNTELFLEKTMVRWASYYQKLLQEIVPAVDKPIANISLLPDREWDQLVVQWNATKAIYLQDQCIHQLIEIQAKQQPDAIAVICQNQQLTYDQLNKSANQLAHYLRTQGIGPEVLAGVFMERCPEMIIAILAILKAGGTYVPIDPRYPKEHIAHVMEDAQLQIILTQQSLQQLLPVQMKRIYLDTQWRMVSAEKSDNPVNIISPQNLAYVIYTSGSTGKPKGAGVTHGNVAHSTCARLDYYQTRVSSFLLLSSIAFDSSVAGIFGTLCQGSRLVLSTEDAVLDPDTLVQIISAYQISHLLTVPSLYEEILQKISYKKGNGLKQIIVAGEPCRKNLVELHDIHLPQVELFNEYGPTETTVWSSVYQCNKANDHVIPIGRPIPNTQIYLLDMQWNPVPVGVIGELYIGGEGLTRGYLNRADVTAECYIPNLFDHAGSRLYRTGDLARYHDDGNIEYVGRTDHQVKIRGFRIELGEIENVLRQYPKIKDAVVLAREDTLGNKRLVAYMVASGLIPSIDEIRMHLKEYLPDQMIPAAYVFLDHFPLTPNGKVDRKALPIPDFDVRFAIQYVAPRTYSENIIANIWAEVLGVECIGIYDNFFALGGHSLLIAQVISRIRQTFAIDLPLRTLFEKPFVFELALAIDTARTQDQLFKAIPLERVPRTQMLPLSYAQERLWFLDQFEPGSASYNLPGAVRLIGALDVTVLKQSLNEIIRRHEILRTTFGMVDGRPEQLITPTLDLDITVVDLGDLAEDARELKIRQYLEQDAQLPFDLTQGPLVRASLLSLGVSKLWGATEHILLFTLHHIVSDGWSTAILIREFTALYQTYKAGQFSPLPELTLQYADYAIWQREWLQGERLAQQLNYWKQHLAGAPAVVELPIDRPRPVIQSYRGATLHFTIPQTVTAQLKELGRRQDATLFMVLLAAFNILLARYSGQRDLCVGTPIANRNRLEIEGLIGFFVNTLVLRTDLSGNPSFIELLKRVKEICLGAQAHQDLPFEKLVEELAPVRNMSHHPLFQVMLALQNAPETALEIEGLRITPEVMEIGTSKFDLDLEISERQGRLVIQLSYNTDLFDESTVMRMAQHYGVLLENIAATPDRRLSELTLLTEVERKQLITEWQGIEADYPREQCIHQLIEAQAKRRPDAVAVVYAGAQLTYGELNRQANRLAWRLRTQGVGAEELVGICVERSLEMVVGILGILKAGGAYLPIDPSYPKERLAYMVEDACPILVLIHEATRGVMPGEVNLIDLSVEDHSVEQLHEDNPTCLVRTQNLAYVIYTSGSTGKPKGSCLAHQGVVNRLVWMQQQYQLNEKDRVLQKTPFSFDVSVWEFFWPLIVGARLVMLPPGAHKDSESITEWIQQQQISTLHFVPSMLSVFLDTAEAAFCQSLKHVFCSGEALPVSLQEQFYNRFPARLHNLYGPTEASVDVTYWACIPDSGAMSIPIGRPIANTRIYLLDADLNLIPAGVAGELYIGGVGLARGYLNQSDLTAERFIPDPFEATGGRLYRTGDLARYRPDGIIEYIGRTDHQVKIRGFRIELGEIEAMLLQHAHIKEAIVVTHHEDARGDPHLVAYVVEKEVEVGADELRAYLKEFLPDYMVPAVFVVMDCLPLNTNGKVDRKALPAPKIDILPFAHQYVAPRTPIEETITLIWAEVLGLERIGIHDNFFELGGHSLLATQIISRVRTKFHTKIPLRAVFEATTVADLAHIVEVSQWVQMSDTVEAIKKDIEYEDIAF